MMSENVPLLRISFPGDLCFRHFSLLPSPDACFPGQSLSTCPFVSFLKRQNPESHKACVFCPRTHNAGVHKGIPLVFCPQGKLWSLYKGISVVICPKGHPTTLRVFLCPWPFTISLRLCHRPRACSPSGHVLGPPPPPPRSPPPPRNRRDFCGRWGFWDF